MELAAAGVSIAVFNQASRITVFPLVSITTSFVAEEDTIQKMIAKAAAENDKADLLQDIENGTSKQNNIKALKDEVPHEDVEKSATTEKNDTNAGDGKTSRIRQISYFSLIFLALSKYVGNLKYYFTILQSSFMQSL